MAQAAQIEIDGVPYYPATYVLKSLRISRQTLWKWRQEGKVSSGHRYRDRLVVFTEEEIETIREHANRIEPVRSEDAAQLRLFDPRRKGAK